MDLQFLVDKKVPDIEDEKHLLYVKEIIAELPHRNGGIFDVEREVQFSKVALYQILLFYKSATSAEERNADDFINYMISIIMVTQNCVNCKQKTREHSKYSAWKELIFGRITASRFY